MRALILALIFVSFNVFANCDKIYFKVGAGYKLDERKQFIIINRDTRQPVNFYSTPARDSARFELAVDCTNLTYGISHHSQWSTGWPFNKVGEPYKTEVFIDYKFEWNI